MGTIDAVYTFSSVSFAYASLKSKAKWSAAVFAMAILTKTQAIDLAPLWFSLFYKKTAGRPCGFFGCVCCRSLGSYFAFDWSNTATFLNKVYFVSYNGFKFTSVNALNLWGPAGFYVPDGNLFLLGWTFFGVLTVAVLYVLQKRLAVSHESLVTFCAFMLFFGFFMLPTRIHERYLFPAISMLVLTLPFLKKTRPLYIVLTGTLLFNQAYVLYFLTGICPSPQRRYVAVFASAINFAALI
jgi:Gpi18-like mannosyltransferase